MITTHFRTTILLQKSTQYTVSYFLVDKFRIKQLKSMVDKYISEKNAINKGFYYIIHYDLTFTSQLKKHI